MSTDLGATADERGDRLPFLDLGSNMSVEALVIRRHALRPALLPVISFLGPALAGIISGSFVVETIFQIPGMGREFVSSAFDRDYTLVLGTVILYAVLITTANLLSGTNKDDPTAPRDMEAEYVNKNVLLKSGGPAMVDGVVSALLPGGELGLEDAAFGFV